MVVNNVKPTAHQKTVLAIIASSATPKIAAEDLTSNPNTKEAADLLVQLGAVSVENGEAVLTQVGDQLARDENIIDEMGGLTPNGTVYLKMFQKNKVSDDTTEELPSVAESATLIAELLALKR